MKTFEIIVSIVVAKSHNTLLTNRLSKDFWGIYKVSLFCTIWLEIGTTALESVKSFV